MDISVSRLNNRMVLQVPNELPLGLVFIVGTVSHLSNDAESEDATFVLKDAGYQLHCRLPSHVVSEALLQDEQQVRAGGQLSFDAQEARYYLQARSIDVIAETSSVKRPSLSPILDDLKMRADTANIARAELPSWVKKLAPPEVQAELGLIEEVDWEELDEPQPEAMPEKNGALSEDMVSYLSGVIDSEEEVELTPELLATLIPLQRTEGEAPQQAKGVEQPEDSSTNADSTIEEEDSIGDVEKEREVITATLPVMPARRQLLLMLLIVLVLIFLTLLALVLTQVANLALVG